MSADEQPTIPPEFLAQMQRTHAMRQMTIDELLLGTWEFIEDGATAVDFIVDGNLSWESESGAAIKIPGGELAPDLYDPPGARTPGLLEKFRSRSLYRLSIETDAIDHADPAGGRVKLASAIRSACVIADAISVLAEQPVKLRATRRLPVLYRQGSPGEASGDAVEPDRTVMTFVPMEEAAEMTSSVLTDDWIRSGLSAFLYALRSVPDSNVRRTLEVALSWHAQANRIGGLGQYAQYWASIELLASFFYEYCKPEFIGRKSNDAIRAEVLARLNDMASNELNETIRDCGELLRPTAQTKVRALLSVIFPKPQKEDRRNKIRGLLFAKENGPDGKPIRNSKSLYDIRNDVAHGNISALDRDYYDQHAERLGQFRSVSQAFILGVLESVPDLIANRQVTN